MSNENDLTRTNRDSTDLPDVIIDWGDHTVYMDGVELPWMIDSRGPSVERTDGYPVVLLPVLASVVQEIFPNPEGVGGSYHETA